MIPGSPALGRLAARIAAEGDPLEPRPQPGAVPSYGEDDPRFGELAAAGPRAAADPGRYAFVVEAIREGYLCHYGEARLLELPDPDLALLAGDLFYAIGLNELSGLADLESTGILSDLIRIAADLRAGGEPDLAEILWAIQITALSCGKPEGYDELLTAVSEGDTDSLDRLFGWAESTAGRSGTGLEFGVAAKAIHLRPSNL